MGSFKTLGYDNFQSATVTALNGHVDYSPSRVQDYKHLRKYWRSVDTAESALVFNFGAATQIYNTAIFDVNFESYKIQANPTDSWASPAYDSGLLTATKNNLIDRYNDIQEISLNYQYVRILIPTQTPTDGLIYFRVGTIIIGNAALSEVVKNPQFSLNYQANKSYLENKYPSGPHETVNIGDYRIWEGSFSYMVSTEDMAAIWYWLDLDEDDLFLLFLNRDIENEVYLCNRQGKIEISEPGSTYRTTKQIFIREVI